MTAGLWVLVAIGVGIAYLFIFAMCKMSADSDREARHLEKKMVPWSDVTVTQYR
jgi:uncharacterized membrane protein YgaE (UPF0421/DUF939 family)